MLKSLSKYSEYKIALLDDKEEIKNRFVKLVEFMYSFSQKESIDEYNTFDVVTSYSEQQLQDITKEFELFTGLLYIDDFERYILGEICNSQKDICSSLYSDSEELQIAINKHKKYKSLLSDIQLTTIQKTLTFLSEFSDRCLTFYRY